MFVIKSNTRTVCKWLFLGVISAVTVASLLPMHQIVATTVNDKLAHTVCYFILMALWQLSWPGYLAAGLLVLAGHGMVIEVMQFFVEYRTFSQADWLADLIGMAGYLMLERIWKQVR